MPQPPEFTPYKLEQIRLAHGMGVMQFAEYLGVTRQTIANWESGRSVPTGPAARVFELLREKHSV
jgi:DNA-binding transcriptional regulator YiaG